MLQIFYFIVNRINFLHSYYSDSDIPALKKGFIIYHFKQCLGTHIIQPGYFFILDRIALIPACISYFYPPFLNLYR